MLVVSLSLSESMVQKIDSLKKDRDLSRSRCASLILKQGFESLENKGIEDLW